MKRITTTASHHIVAAAIKCSWAVQTAGERKQSLGVRMEDWAHRVAVRWGCVDDVLTAITTETSDR